ncbi:DNA pilot protein [Sigmofec virus UA08Rod_6083]|uniref:DNA pilot protein n=1 Tax=Sigmofec virus UA08Rod_6083 TaxID=2929451 RepID=A0A976N0Z4_9VIRU|nr:DNA pilot protein [Sigmofec virus UA08Rod_6083]
MANPNIADIAGAALGGVKTLSDVATDWLNFGQNKKNREHQAWMQSMAHNYAMEQQWDAQRWQKSFWEMSNEYNLPSNVRQRLADAGLNEALMYSGDVSGATAASAPSSPIGSNPSGSAPSPIPLRGLGTDSLRLPADISKVFADRDKSLADVQTQSALRTFYDSSSQLNLAKSTNMDIDTDLKRLDRYFNESTMDQRLDNFDLNNQMLHQELRNLKDMVSWAEKNRPVEYETLKKQYSIIEAEAAVRQMDVAYYKANGTTMNQAQIDLWRSLFQVYDDVHELNGPDLFRMGKEMEYLVSGEGSSKIFKNIRQDYRYKRFQTFLHTLGQLTGVGSDIVDIGLSFTKIGAVRKAAAGESKEIGSKVETYDGDGVLRKVEVRDKYYDK